MEPSLLLTQSQTAALERMRQLGELHFADVSASLPVRPRLWPLLVGPTGAGKSFLVRQAATRLGASYLPVSYGGWIVQGARQVSTPYTIIHTALDCPRLVVHLDELDKMPVGVVGDWAQAVANEVWALLDGQLPTARFAHDPELKDVLNDRERAALLQRGVMPKVFLVGSGTWQSTFDEAGSAARGLGFGRTVSQTMPSEHVVGALEAVRGPSSELLARFDGKLLFIGPPSLSEAEDILAKLGLVSFAVGIGLNVRGELARLLPRQGFRAVESVLTEALLRGWRPGHVAEIEPTTPDDENLPVY